MLKGGRLWFNGKTVIYTNELFSISLFSTPTGVETPDVIDLRKQQRKEPEKLLYQVSISIFSFAILFQPLTVLFLVL